MTNDNYLCCKNAVALIKKFVCEEFATNRYKYTYKEIEEIFQSLSVIENFLN